MGRDTGIDINDLVGVLNGKSIDANKANGSDLGSSRNGNEFVVGKTILELTGSDPVELTTGELVIICVNDRPSSRVVVFEVSSGTTGLEFADNPRDELD